tara:strand:- start:1018 stop:1206 length:189 start_codon:yes stop_codon:yes gene_type:complete
LRHLGSTPQNDSTSADIEIDNTAEVARLDDRFRLIFQRDLFSVTHFTETPCVTPDRFPAEIV